MRRFHVLSALLASLISSGCTFLPEIRESPLTTAEVIRHLKCEVFEAAYGYPENAWVRSWTVGLIFELQVNHLGGIDADTNIWTFPLNHGATFSIALAGGFSGQGTRTERVNFKFKPSEFEKDPYQCEADAPDRRALLGGALGIADLFKRVGLTAKVANVKKWQSLDYNLEFVVKANAGLTPRFNLIPIGKEKTYTGSAKWTGSRMDTQSVKMSLTPPPDQPVCAVEPSETVGWYDPEECPKPVYMVQVEAACKTIKKKNVCEAARGCSWSDAKCDDAPGAKIAAARGSRVYRPIRKSVPAKVEEENNNSAQLLNTLNSLKIGN